MKNLYIEAREATPEIFFDCEKNILEIKGVSYPENTAAFYGPVFFWLEEYFSLLENDKVTVNLEIVYFNSNSWKILVGFFELLDKIAGRGTDINVNWNYEEDDEDMLESGKDFQEDHGMLLFNFIQRDILRY